LATAYCMIIILLIYTYFIAVDFRISRKVFWNTVFESLICPPCGANLIRKISQQANIYYAGAEIVSK
jgi:hypothetical protein